MSRKTLLKLLWRDCWRSGLYITVVYVLGSFLAPDEALAEALGTAMICGLYCHAQYSDRKRKVISE